MQTRNISWIINDDIITHTIANVIRDVRIVPYVKEFYIELYNREDRIWNTSNIQCQDEMPENGFTADILHEEIQVSVKRDLFLLLGNFP